MNYQKNLFLLALAVSSLFVFKTDIQAQHTEKAIQEAASIAEAPSKSIDDFEYTIPTYDIKEGKAKISTGTHNGFTIFIPHSDIDKVEKRWMKLMKKKKAKPMGDFNEIMAPKAKIKTISSERIDVTSTMKLKGSGVELTALYQIGDEFISSKKHPSKVKSIERMLSDFALIFARYAEEDMLKQHKKDLKLHNKDLKIKQKEQDKIDTRVIKYKKLLMEAELEKSSNVEEQNLINDDINTTENNIIKSDKKINLLKKYNKPKGLKGLFSR